MKAKTIIETYGRWILTAVFAVAVFCFWMLKLPFLMSAREQMQLFLWNTDYLMERLAVPGGLAQYLGEFVVQFFFKSVYGALWYAVLFAAVQLLTWRLIRSEKRQKLCYLLSFVPSAILWYLACNPKIPMTPIIAVLLTLVLMNLLPKKQNARWIVSCAMIPIGYWLLGPAVVILAVYLLFSRSGSMFLKPVPLILLAFCVVGSAWMTPYPLKQIARGIDYYWDKECLGSFDDMEYDMLMRQQRWGEMIEKFNKKGSESLSVHNAVLIVMWQEQRIGQQDVLSRINLDQRALCNIPSAFLMSEFCMPIGMANMAQRAAFEAMEAIPNHNKSARALQQLVETNLVTGSPKVALKYIFLLEQTLFYRSWAGKMKEMAKNPELLKENPVFYQMKEIYDNEEDMLFY
jgi:hypothetical protein